MHADMLVDLLTDTNRLASGSALRTSRLDIIGFLIDFFEDVQKDSIDLNPFGLGFKIQKDAMPQGWQVDASNVFVADVVTSVEQGADFRGQRDGLSTAGASSPSDVLVGDCRCQRATWMRGQNQSGYLILDMFGQDDLSDQALPLDDLGSVHDLLGLDGEVSCGSIDDGIEFLAVRVTNDELE